MEQAIPQAQAQGVDETGQQPQNALDRFLTLPPGRQAALLVAVAASIAVIVAVVLWARQPSYALLFGNMPERDAAQVVEALRAANVPYRLDERSGQIMVPARHVHETRLQLAAQGLPQGGARGFELLDTDQGFGVSQFMETARYHRAIEGELARSVMTLRGVESARVHLALPRQTVFVRDRQKPSASVLVHLSQGRGLSHEQVDAIIHLVAASIPEMEPEQVTVVDQHGRLLTGNRDRDPSIGRNEFQFEYARRLEQNFIARIEHILAPVVGAQGVRAQVVADIDFSETEKTQELFNPDMPALRSEQIEEERSTGRAPGGIPGALSNEPPAAGVAPEVAADGAGVLGSGGTERSLNRATRNFELDKTISHTRLASGTVRRLSVAVVVDDHAVLDEEGQLQRQPRDAAEIERITALVRDAVGFDPRRGDTVSVINASFALEEAEPFSVPIYQQPWFHEVLKGLFALIVVLVVALGVLRPLIRGILAPPAPPAEAGAGSSRGAGGEGRALGPDGEPLEDDQVTLSGGAEGGTAAAAMRRRKEPEYDPYEEYLKATKEIVTQDPKKVAQVVRTWLQEE